jgi:hypothetical protein
MSYSDRIDPYSVLNISPDSSIEECRSAYKRLATKDNRRIRQRACLAYDILCNKEKYIKEGNYYRVKKKDCFYYTVVGDLNSLRRCIERNKNLLYEKDGLKRNLLYLSARNGYFNLTEYLIKKGININEVQSCGSTALHGAAYYGQELVIQLLIENGIDTKIKNNFGSTADEEACTPRIKEIILKSHEDKIMTFFHRLYNLGYISNIIPIKKNDKIIAQKLICSKHLLPMNSSQIYSNWDPVWHGTKFQFLESIIKNGLRPSGSKLADGTTINPLPTHIPLNETFSGIKNWGKAIFVSPSIFYSADAAYAERILSNSGSTTDRWAVLVEARVRPNSYTKHNSTIWRDKNIENEPVQVEYRVESKENDDLIYRVESEKNIFIISITFVLVKFLENVSDYCEGNIVVNSEEERNLLL